MDDEIYGTEDYDGSEAWDESGYHEWDPSPSHHDEAEYYEDPEAFDSSAAYYQYDDETAEEHPWHDVESYDQAYAAYLDARKRFNDLKISRGYLPVVALTDPAVGNVSPGVLSPSSAGSSPKGKKGKLKSTSSKGNPSSTYKYTKISCEGCGSSWPRKGDFDLSPMRTTWPLCSKLSSSCQKWGQATSS